MASPKKPAGIKRGASVAPPPRTVAPSDMKKATPAARDATPRAAVRDATPIASAPVIAIRSRTGRPFRRSGMLFLPDAWTCLTDPTVEQLEDPMLEKLDVNAANAEELALYPGAEELGTPPDEAGESGGDVGDGKEAGADSEESDDSGEAEPDALEALLGDGSDDPVSSAEEAPQAAA